MSILRSHAWSPLPTPPDRDAPAQRACPDPPPAVDDLAEWLVAHGFGHRGSTFDVASGEANHVFRRGGLAVRLAGGAQPWQVELSYRRFGEEWFELDLLRLYLELRRPVPAGMDIANQAAFVMARLQEIAVLVSQDAVGGHLRALRAIRAVSRRTSPTEPPD